MTGFVPRECLSCVDALNETFQDLFGTTQSFSEAKWSVVFSDPNVKRSAGLKHQAADRMKQAVHKLQGQLFEGERTACYVSDNGLKDMKSALFGTQNASEIIAKNGQIRPELVGPSVTFFVRPKGYEHSGHSGGSEEKEDVALEKNTGGRPGTGRDAAIVYWVLYPDGHDSTKIYWRAVLDEVNEHLRRLGLPTVKESSLKSHVTALAPSKA